MGRKISKQCRRKAIAGTHKIEEVPTAAFDATLHLAARQDYSCSYCGLKWTHITIDGSSIKLHTENFQKNHTATIDHRMPRGFGGSDSFANKCASCFECNNLKGHTFLASQKEFALNCAYEIIDNLLKRYFAHADDGYDTIRNQRSAARLNYLRARYDLNIEIPQEVSSMLEVQ